MIGYGWLMTGVLASAILGTVAGQMYGYSRGQKDAQLVQHKAEVNELNALIVSARTLVDESNHASQAMRQVVSSRMKADEQTTRELKRVLQQTEAVRRAVCNFDDDSMRIIQQARDSAANAAAAGIRGSVPGTTPAQ